MEYSPKRWHGGFSVRKGATFLTPLPTQIVSNEEFFPIGQTAEQARVEHATGELVEKAAGRLGATRREFLTTTGGLAAALLAMNSVFGRFFNIGDIELFEATAFAEQQGTPYFLRRTNPLCQLRLRPLRCRSQSEGGRF